MDFQAFYLESAKGFQEIVGSVRNSGMYGFSKNSKKRNLTNKIDSVMHIWNSHIMKNKQLLKMRH